MPPPAYRLTPVKGLSPKAAWYRISDSSNASGHNPLHNQLSAIFNHAVRYYELRSNPAAKVRNMGSEEHREMLFWTKEEYKKFSFEMMDKDVITTPKTKKSNRTIKMPHFLCEEMQEYLGMLYGLKKKDRIFTVTKSYLHHEMDRGAKVAGVKRIRIHDLRHSHISLLIDMGFSAVAMKQEYCYRRCLNQDVVVQGNPRVYKALKQELAAVLAELQRIEAGNGIDEELLNLIELVSVILGGLKGEEQNE